MVSASRYEPVTMIGRGATCEVWLGVLTGAAGFRRPVVLKRASVGVHEDLEEARAALIAEGHLSAALNHPNVVHVYELVDLPEGLMLAMEYLSGLSVRAIRRGLEETEGVLPWAVGARVVADAARGLEYAHQARGSDGAALNIIHRDISPDNLVVTEEGITKIVDFGIARSAMRDHTTGLVVKGNIGYLSPEQARGEPLDERSDIFSLGVVLHELLSGRPLFERDGPGKTLEALLSAPIPPLDRSTQPVARDTARRMLVRDRAQRTITAGEVADALEPIAGLNGGSHRDVAAFLKAEFGERLEERRARLAELLERPQVAPQLEEETAGTGTFGILSGVLESQLLKGRGADPWRGELEAEDTLVDEGLPGTLIERPLLSRDDDGGSSSEGR